AVVKATRSDVDDDRPRRRRRPRPSEGRSLLPFLIGGGVLLVMVLIGVTVVIVVRFGSRDDTPPAHFQAPPAAAAATPQPLAWQEFIAPGKDFVLSVPGPVARMPLPGGSEDASVVELDNKKTL